MPPKKLGTTTVTTTKTVQKGVKGVDPRVQMNRAWENVANMMLGAAGAAVWTVKSIGSIEVAKFVPGLGFAKSAATRTLASGIVSPSASVLIPLGTSLAPKSLSANPRDASRSSSPK